jgi:hypothetical protein
LSCCSAAAAFTVTAGGVNLTLTEGKNFAKSLRRLGDEPSRRAAG